MTLEHEIITNIKTLVGKATLEDFYRTKGRLEVSYTQHYIRKITVAPCCNLSHIYIFEILTRDGHICQFHVSEDIMKSRND